MADEHTDKATNPAAPRSSGTFEPRTGPELVFGVAGAVGTNLSLVCEILAETLHEVRYDNAKTIRLSDLLRTFERNKDIPFEPLDKRTVGLMDAGDELRKDLGRGDAVALLGIPAVQQEREHLTHNVHTPAPRQAYILHSLKRPEEITTLRRVYGRAFNLIAAFASRDSRVSSFAARVAQSHHDFNEDKYRKVAESLITRDEADLTKPFGQAMRSTFPKADVFIDGTSRNSITRGIGRFVDLLFNKPFETPTLDEVGMNFAHAASLRSADLSRQVGAVIMSQAGEVLASGCNETPKPGGGHYWGGDPDDARDFVLGYDPSTKIKSEMITELLHLLKGNDWLVGEHVTDQVRNTVNVSLERLMKETDENGEPAILRDSQITNIIEYGRVVHAEMSAITEAARRGISIKAATLYCTAYPCHICARHIISSGISRVVYVEPYPKSMTQRLYPEATTTDRKETKNSQVLFEPFLVVSPIKYNEVFEIYGARKDKRGDARKWKRGTAEPRLERMIESYLSVEDFAIGALEGGLQRANLTMGH